MDAELDGFIASAQIRTTVDFRDARFSKRRARRASISEGDVEPSAVRYLAAMMG